MLSHTLHVCDEFSTHPSSLVNSSVRTWSTRNVSFQSICTRKTFFSTAGVLFFLILGHTGHKLPLRFVASDKVFCSHFKSVARKAFKSTYKKPGRGGCLSGLHSSSINRFFLLGLQGIRPTTETPFVPLDL